MVETRRAAWRNRRDNLGVPIFGPRYDDDGDLTNDPQYPLLRIWKDDPDDSECIEPYIKMYR